MKLREATVDDIPQMHVIRTSVKENSLSDPGLISPQDYVEYISVRGKGWVSEVGGQLLGFAIIDLKEENVWALFVHPDHERKGVGSALHFEMMDWYFRQGRSVAWLSTAAVSRAETFYRMKSWQEKGMYGKGEIRFEMTSEDWMNRKKRKQMNCNETYVLENEKVMLRPLEVSDYDLLLPYSLNEPGIWKFNSGGAAGAANLRAYIDTTLKQRLEGKEYPFIVFDKRSQKYVGSTRFYDIQPERNTIQLGYTWYASEAQGTGLNRHCKYLLLDFAFGQLGVARVGFGANNANTRSINAMKAIGCTVEGVLRCNGLDAAGNRTDSIVLSILKTEWDAELRAKLHEKITTA